MGEPGFWEDQERAARVSAEHARASRRLSTYNELARDIDDLGPLAELAEEDPEIAGELDDQVASIERRLAQLEEQRLFAGRYDSGDALVTINAGAGGTDAQDWAEMVLRMEMRWAERRCLELIREAGLPEPRTQVRIAGYTVDFVWPDHRVVFEIDGYSFHTSRFAFDRDRRKDAALKAAGYDPNRLSRDQVMVEPYLAIAAISAAIARSARR